MSAPAATVLAPNLSPKFQDLLLEPADNARLAICAANWTNICARSSAGWAWKSTIAAISSG